MLSEFPSLEPIQCAAKQIQDRSVKPLIHPYSFLKY